MELPDFTEINPDQNWIGLDTLPSYRSAVFVISISSY